MSTPSFAGRIIVIIGKIIAAVIEESDTYLVKKTTIKNPSVAIPIAFGAKNKNTPKLVATPFPPLKFRKQEKECPSIAIRPMTTIYFSDTPILLATKSGK